jgi:single-strand DNA-binding protein
MGLPKIQGEVARLWDEVQLRFTPSGKAVASVPLVFNKRKKNSQGEWEDAGSMFVRGTAWDQLGENCAESLSKSDEVVVSGELSTREFERADGTKGQSVELNIWAIGPNLARATAKVNKASRGSDQKFSAPAGEDPWGAAPAGSPIDDGSPPF